MGTAKRVRAIRFELGTTPVLQNDGDLIILTKERMRFKREKALQDPQKKLELIEYFRTAYENTDQDTVAWAPEFVIVCRKIMEGFRPVVLFYLTDFEGELEGANDAHREAAKKHEVTEELKPNILYDLLSLVLEDFEMPTYKEVHFWSYEQQLEAEKWAGAVHLHASDNYDVKVPPRPIFIPIKDRPPPCNCTTGAFDQGHTCGKELLLCPDCHTKRDAQGQGCQCQWEKEGG